MALFICQAWLATWLFLNENTQMVLDMITVYEPLASTDDYLLERISKLERLSLPV